MLFVFSLLLHFLQSVQSLVSNLLISHIELRSDESPDIRAYSHQRSVEKVVVPLGEILSAHQARYLQVGTIQVAPCNLKISEFHHRSLKNIKITLTYDLNTVCIYIRAHRESLVEV